MFAGLKQSLGQYEQWVEQEERALAAGPEAHATFLQVRVDGLRFGCPVECVFVGV